MDPIKNPFAPGAGHPPPALVGRDAIFNAANVVLARVKDGKAAKNHLLLGLRGVGKTVLLNKIQSISDTMGYQSIWFEADEARPLRSQIIPQMRQLLLHFDRRERVNDRVKRSLRVLASFASAVKVKVGDVQIGLDIEPEVGIADSGDLTADLTDLFSIAAEAAQSESAGILLAIDEMQNLSKEDLTALVMALHKASQRQLPLTLFGAGLPQIVGRLGESKSYTERLFTRIPIGALEAADARKAIWEPVEKAGASIGQRALGQITEVTQCYPYFLQTWGYHAWNAAKGSDIDLRAVQASHAASIRDLDASFFQFRYERLTAREKQYVAAMAALGPGPHKSGAVAKKLGVKAASIAPTRSALIGKGMVYAPTYGETAFTVPLFDQFVGRQSGHEI